VTYVRPLSHPRRAEPSKTDKTLSSPAFRYEIPPEPGKVGRRSLELPKWTAKEGHIPFWRWLIVPYVVCVILLLTFVTCNLPIKDQ
jgi:hypothetical protein